MGIFNWASQKVSNQGNRLKGFVRRITSADELEKNGLFIIGMVKQIGAQPEEVVQETFENAYQRLGLTEESLSKTYNSLMMRFNIFLFFAVLGLILGVYYATQGALGAIASIGFLAYCLAHLFIASFRMLQIRKRELVPVSYWVAAPEEWWPKPFVPLRKKRPSNKNLPSDKPKSNSAVVDLNDRRNRKNKG